jgi:protein-S-isoprenylcysteine O-methyltransferase Ste14
MFLVRTIAWLIAIVYSTIPSYWLLVHPRARRWAEQGGRPLRAIGPAWLLLWLVVGTATWPWRLIAAYQLRWTWILGSLIIVSGFVIYWFGRKNFSTDQVLGRSELEPHRHEQALRTTGIRSRIRHPYYLGHFCELTGWTVGSGLIVVYVLLLFAIVSGYFMIRAEERELEQRFGREYQDYRQRTAAMFPGVW